MRVLVLGDNEPVAHRLRDLLQREGHECQTAAAVDPRAGGEDADLVVVAASDPEQLLTSLRSIRRFGRGRLLAVGPATEPKLILRVLREGAEQYLDEAELETELLEALSRLRSEQGPQEQGQVIAVLPACGGCGTSTIAANVAVILAQEYKKVCLIDLNLLGGDLAALLDLKPPHTLAELCLNLSRMDWSMFERCLVSHEKGVHLLAPPMSLADAGLVTAEAVGKVLDFARGHFPYLVVDLEQGFREQQTEALRRANVVLLVFRLDFTCLRRARRALEQLEQLGIRREQVRLVANRCGQPKELPLAKAEEALDMKVYHQVPDEPKTMNYSNNHGVPAVINAPRSAVARSIQQLAHGVNGRRPPAK